MVSSRTAPPADASQTTETAAMTRAITTRQETTALTLTLFMAQFIAASAAVAGDLTDCDDVGQPMEGWYGEIRVRPR